ncbi:MAG: hypothetical protein WCO10_02380 [bacterium]
MTIRSGGLRSIHQDGFGVAKPVSLRHCESTLVAIHLLLPEDQGRTLNLQKGSTLVGL